jgi:Protein of unknown function (DUF2752)
MHGRQSPYLTWWVRGGLIAITFGLGVIFGIARWLEPYDQNGSPLRMETHRQLGLPPCTFFLWTRLPCPTCGMTTSFALLMRGDVRNSLHANSVGTLLALVCLVSIPWSLGSAIWGRLVGVRSWETILARGAIVFFVLLLVRWGIVVGGALLAR